MHVGIANPRWRGKRSRHFQRIRNPQFYVSGKRPIHCITPNQHDSLFKPRKLNVHICVHICTKRNCCQWMVRLSIQVFISRPNYYTRCISSTKKTIQWIDDWMYGLICDEWCFVSEFCCTDMCDYMSFYRFHTKSTQNNVTVDIDENDRWNRRVNITKMFEEEGK